MTPVTWRKSSYSNNGGECLEIALDAPGLVPVRDSKDPSGPTLAFPAESWRSFLLAVQAGEFGAV